MSTAPTSSNTDVGDDDNKSVHSKKRLKVSFLNEPSKQSKKPSSLLCNEDKDESLKDVYKRRHEIFAFFGNTKKPTDKINSKDEYFFWN